MPIYSTSAPTDLLQSYVCSTCQADYVTTTSARSGGHYTHIGVDNDPGGGATRDNPYPQDILIGLWILDLLAIGFVPIYSTCSSTQPASALLVLHMSGGLRDYNLSQEWWPLRTRQCG